MEVEPQTILRIMCGLWFLPHAVLKVINADRAQATFAEVGFRPGRLFLFATVAMEIVAATGLVFDWFSRIAAALGIFVLVGASYAVVRMNGWNWRWNRQGLEFTIFWSFACIIAVL